MLQGNPFRGMFPRSKQKEEKRNEEAEDRMASRLHLDLGQLSFSLEAVATIEDMAEQDALAKKSQKDRAVNVFRGVSFDDWLRIIMQVGGIPYTCIFPT